jgi:exoribonuclease-2
MVVLHVQSGSLIEYLDNGKFTCALVTESQPTRVRLLNQNGREVNLPVSRIVHCSRFNHQTAEDRTALVKFLQDTTRKRHSLMEQIDLETLWELIVAENSETFEPSFLAELMFGRTADDDLVSAFLRSVFRDRLFFKYREGKITAHPPEKVEQLKHQREKEAEKRTLIDEACALLARISDQGEQAAPFTQSEQNILSLVQDYYLFGKESKDADTGALILKQSGYNRPHDPYHILVKSGFWPKNVNVGLLRHQLPVSFAVPARHQAERLLRTGNEQLFADPDRLDLTHLKPLTIDGITTLDFDDALSIEEQDGNYLVGIHISDVAHYVRPGDPLFQEAMARGTSVYFPEGQIPMLPRHLSQGICSLIQGEIRAAFSHLILLSPEAEVLKVSISPSIIKVARRLSYEDGDRLAETDPELRLLALLKNKLRRRRIEAGALLLPFPDVNIHLDANARVSVSLGRTDTTARTIVSELMILANTEAARFVSDRMAPGLFRGQGKINRRLVQGEDDDLYRNTLQRKHLPRSELTTAARPHSGLGVSQYTTITSPIRRLLDLVMQHQINAMVRQKRPYFTEEMCKDFTSVINRTVSTANIVKQQRQRYWLLKHLEEKIDSWFDALIIDTSSKRSHLLLTALLMDVDLPATSIPPGSLVQIRLIAADAVENTLRFSW